MECWPPSLETGPYKYENVVYAINSTLDELRNARLFNEEKILKLHPPSQSVPKSSFWVDWLVQKQNYKI